MAEKILKTPLIWMENLPRKLNFIPHVRNLSYNPHFTLTSEYCCRSLQFCLRVSSRQTQFLKFEVDDQPYKVAFPHLMVKRYGQQIKFKNASEAEVVYFSYLPEYGQYFFQGGLPEHFIVEECVIPFDLPSTLKKLHDYTRHLGCPAAADHLDMFCFNLIADLILNLNLSRVQTDENSEKIQQIVSYLQLHYCDAPNFDVLARKYGFSHRSFRRHWQKNMNQPPGEYVANLRLLEARRLLKESSMKTAEIAWKLGFSDDSYFGRFFRLRTGMTPREYRKNRR